MNCTNAYCWTLAEVGDCVEMTVETVDDIKVGHCFQENIFPNLISSHQVMLILKCADECLFVFYEFHFKREVIV